LAHFRTQASFDDFWARSMKMSTWAYQYLVYNRWKLQLRILNCFGEKLRTTRPFKNEKNWDISRPEVTSSKQKIRYKIFLILNKIWKFRLNRSSRFREILCTKSVGKRIIIITRCPRCEQRIGLPSNIFSDWLEIHNKIIITKKLFIYR